MSKEKQYEKLVMENLKGQHNTELSKFINAYKSASSRFIKKKYSKIKNNYGKNTFGVGLSVCLQLVV